MVTREDVIAVATRLFAVFLVVTTIRAIAQSANPLFGEDLPLPFLLLALSLYLATILVAALLWFFPLSVARKLLPVARDSATVPAVSHPTFPALAFSVLGGWVLASALSDSVYWLVFFVYSERAGVDYSVSPDYVASMVATGAELLIGVYLLFGSQGFVGLLHRFRYAGS